MTELDIATYITSTFPGVESVDTMNATFFMYDPEHKLPPERRWPFATIVTTDEHDTDRVSNLDRPGVFRLNLGVSKETFQSLVPDREAVHDFAALDRLMPHPVYGQMYWLCVLNPSDATFEQIKPLLSEAFDLAAARLK